MGVSVSDFLKLAVQSRLFSESDAAKLEARLHSQATPPSDGAVLADWLVKKNLLTKFQAKVLSAGRPGPFFYGDYKVLDRGDAGRFAGLFQALHVPTKCPLQLHFLSGGVAGDPALLAAYGAWVQKASAARHDHLWSCFPLVDQGSYKFVPLGAYSAIGGDEAWNTGPLPVEDACRYVQQTASALEAYHRAGLIHGDVRPANLFLVEKKSLRLLAAPLVAESLPVARRPSELLAQQADYLAPELTAAPDRAPDVASDVYSLGCLLYHLLTGQPPFAQIPAADKAAQHAQAMPRSVQEINRQAPTALALLCVHLLTKAPAGRFQRFAQVADAVGAFLPHSGVKPAIPKETAAEETYREHLRKAPVAASGPAVPQAIPVAAEKAMPVPVAAVPVSAVPIAAAATPIKAVPVSAAPVAGVPRAVPAGGVPAGIPMAAPVAAVVNGNGNGHHPPAAVPMATPVGGVAVPRAAPVAVAGAVPLATPVPSLPTAVAMALPAIEPLVPEVAPVIPGALSAHTRALARRRRSTSLLALGGLGLLVAVVSAGIFLWPRNTPVVVQDDDEEDKPAPAQPTPEELAAAAAAEAAAAEDPSAERMLVLDRPMWQSPTSGAPWELKYLPPNPQAFVGLHPAALLGSEEGQRLIEGLGPLGALGKEQLQKLTGVDPAGIERALIGLHDNRGDAPPRVSLVAWLKKAVNEEEWLGEIGSPTEEAVSGKKVFVGAAGRVWMLPDNPAGKNRLIVSVELPEGNAEIENWLSTIADPQLPVAPLEAMRRTTDADRHLTLVTLPAFFFSGAAKAAFDGGAARMKDPLYNFVSQEDGNLPRSLGFSLHLDESLFLELRVLGTGVDEPLLLAKTYGDRTDALDLEFTDYSTRLNTQEYGRRLLARFPKMLEVLGDMTVAGAQEKQSVLRAYLPVAAAHNLALNTQLAVLEVPGAAATVVAGTPSKTPVSMADKLKMKISLSFPRNTLEKCMEMVGEEIGGTVEILGSDLQLEGITKNQSFGLDERDKTASEILMTVMKKANPDGKLLYIIRKEGNTEKLLITTRSAVAKRKDPIPPEWETK